MMHLISILRITLRASRGLERLVRMLKHIRRSPETRLSRPFVLVDVREPALKYTGFLGLVDDARGCCFG